jgi:hypothetical protein
MSRYLHVNYAQLQYWAHPLRTALTAKSSLHQRDQKWQSSNLSDLAFSITTRIGAIQELVRLTNGASSIARRLSSCPTCHKYDCRNDKCVWLDFDKMIPAPMPDVSSNASVAMAEVALKYSMQAKEE